MFPTVSQEKVGGIYLLTYLRLWRCFLQKYH